ncbi:MAG: PA14 domain-containing protein [Ilumatobacteraceae bacterium]
MAVLGLVAAGATVAAPVQAAARSGAERLSIPAAGRATTGEPPAAGTSTPAPGPVDNASKATEVPAAPTPTPTRTKLDQPPAAKSTDGGKTPKMASKPISGFDPATSKEDVSQRSADATTYLNADGTETIIQSSMPVHFKDAAGAWQKIDNHVVQAKDGSLTNVANGWRVSFRPMTAGGVTVRTSAGDVTFAARGAASVAPVVEPDGESVRYPDVLPGTDIVYQVTGAGVEELLVLKTPLAQPTVTFDVSGTALDRTTDGLVPRDKAVADGGLRITPPETFDASGLPFAAEDQVFAVADAGKTGSTVQVGVTPAAMAARPADAFPITVDPNVVVGVGATWVHSYANNTSTGAAYASYNDGYARVGNPYLGSGNPVRWRSVGWFDYSAYFGASVLDAWVSTNVVDGTGSGTQPLNVYWASQDGFHYGAAPNYYTSTVPGSATVANGWSAYMSGSLNTGAVSQNGNLRDLYNVWTRTSTYGGALLFSGQEGVNGYTFKKFSVSIGLTINRWPSPPSGGFAMSGRTAQFWSASASDPDSDAVRFMYRVVDENTGAVIDSYGGGQGQYSDWTSATSFNYQVPQSWSGHSIRGEIYDWDSVCGPGECHVNGAVISRGTATNTAPTAPGLTSPANGTSSHNLTQTLTASASSDANTVPPATANGDTVYYAFYYCTTSTCGTKNYFVNSTTTSTTASWNTSGGGTWSQAATFPSTFYGQTFWWGVDGYDGMTVTSSGLWQITLTNAAPTVSAMAPVNGTVMTSQVPALSATIADSDDSGSTLSYNFVLTPTLGTGILAQSGWLTAPSGANVSFTPPDRTAAWLSADVGYSWHVDTKDSFGAASTSATFTLTPNSRLGVASASPMQTAGPVAVNMGTGNLFLAATADKTMSTVGGDVGVGLSYNSQDRSMLGLRGVYYVDGNANSAPDGGEIKMVRVDTTPSFDWGSAAPAESVPADFSVRWTGMITVPSTGSWVFGGGHDDNLSIKVNGTTVYSQTCCLATKTANPFTTSTAIWLTANTPVPIQIDFSDTGGAGYVEFRAKNTANGTESTVTSDWFTAGTPQPLPTGWTLSGDNGLSPAYAKVQRNTDNVTLVGVDGSEQVWTKTTGDSGSAVGVAAYTPSPESDDTLVVNADQTVTVQGGDGLVYQFSASGTLTDVRSVADDLKPAGAQYNYTADNDPTTPTRLTSIQDRLAPTRKITLVYNQTGLGTCPTAPSGFDTLPPAGMLCEIDYPDGTATRLFYQSGLLARISQPGDETPAGTGVTAAPEGRAVIDMIWTAGKLTSVITPSDRDRITAQDAGAIPAANKIPTADLRTDITWTADGKPNVITLPRPQAGAPRPADTFAYPTSGTANVTVAGIAATARTVTFDPAGRTLTDTDAVGRTTSTTWSNAADFVYRTVSAGRTTSTIYDINNHPTDVYGPSPSSCFSTTAPYAPNGTCTGQVPHTHTDYDHNVKGLQGVYWSSPNMAGTPAGHSMGPNGSGDVTYTWADPTAPQGVTGQDNWSARFTGIITLPATGNYTFRLKTGTTDNATLYLNDKAQIVTTPANQDVSTGTINPGSSLQIRVRIDFKAGTGTSSLQFGWTGPSDSSTNWAIGTYTKPGFWYPTKTTTDDTPSSTQVPAQTTTVTRYDEGIDPSYGLVTSTTQDPGGLNLTTATSYETTGDKLLRPLRTTLPAFASAPTSANSTTNTYYTLGATAVNPCVSGSPAVDQAGLRKTSQDPTPASGSAVATEYVYDILGRVVASRYVGDTAWTCSTFDARGRTTIVKIPANSTTPAGRTITTTYDVGGDPYTTAVTDAAGTITTTVDALGRTINTLDVWGVATATVYDQAGRATGSTTTISSPAYTSTTSYTYDNANRLTSESIGGAVVAQLAYAADTATLDPGVLTGVTYPNGAGKAGNGSSGTFTYTNLGAPATITWRKTSDSSVITSDSVTRSLTGKILTEAVDGVGPTWTYTYDAAGRLTRATGTSHDYQYQFTASGGCGADVAAGANSDRSQVIDNGSTIATNCYDNADRLTSTSLAGYTSAISYDAHGNTATLGGEQYTYDFADRHMASEVAGVRKVTYQRDASDRIVARTDLDETTSTSTTQRYGYGGPGDSSTLTLDATNNVVDVVYPLPGGALYTKRGAAGLWSYPNMHGDVTQVTDNNLVTQGATSVYNPDGQLVSGNAADNLTGTLDNGWLGGPQRRTEHAGGLNTDVEMGARIYNPAIGRFLARDPIQGGCANAYTYVFGDPVNAFDISGAKSCGQRWAQLMDLVFRHRPGPGKGMSGLSDRAAGLRKNENMIDQATHIGEYDKQAAQTRQAMKDFSDNHCHPPMFGGNALWTTMGMYARATGGHWASMSPPRGGGSSSPRVPISISSQVVVGTAIVGTILVVGAVVALAPIGL